MGNPSTYQSPKRITLGHYLGSFTLIKGTFKNHHQTRRSPSVSRYGQGQGTSKPGKPLQKTSSTHETLQELADKPSVVLYQASGVFPFELFPDTITIDTEQIKIQHKEFFYIKNVNSINHEDVLNVTVESGPFFAKLKVATRFFHAENLEIGALWKKDAFELRDMIHGLMVARHRGVAIEGTDKKELIDMLKNVGEVGQPTIQTDEYQSEPQ